MRIGMNEILVGLLALLINLALWASFIYVLYLVIKALRKYIASKDIPEGTTAVRRSLGEAIKAHRTRRNMTQELVADRLGVSRQAVSKWESGASEPSTSNLLALCKLFDVSPEEFLGEVQ